MANQKQVINKKNLSAGLSAKPGIYFFKDKQGNLLYVGKSANIKARVRSYFRPNAGVKARQIIKRAATIGQIITASDFDALILEANMIKQFQPRYNTQLKDDKHYLYIKITKEKFPIITTARRENQDAFYFGPYPSSRTVKEVLRIIRQIFPYCTQKAEAKRRCFYSHINLCNPCPAAIRKTKGVKRQQLTQKYRHNIAQIIKLLKGQRPQVEQKLRKQMQAYAQNLQYEQASAIKKQLASLNYIIAHHRSAIAHYLTAMPQRYLKLPHLPLRIEGYDISNTMGRAATAAMVVFIYGEPDKSSYRQFKIKGKQTPDDGAMLQEAICRRLKHAEWDFPQLILVDGGKAQVAAAKAALQKNRLTIPVVGLAKRKETIVLKNKTGFQQVHLPRNSAILQLFQHIRDEAHRFAKKYHTQLRRRQLFNSQFSSTTANI